MSKSRFFYSSTICLFFSFLIFSCRSNKTVVTSLNRAVITRYAEIMGVSEKRIESEIELWKFVNDWEGTPYKFGGKDKNGIDCSAFVSLMSGQVFNKKITGSSSALFDSSKRVNKSDAMEGDFVFFKIESSKISHVGLLLYNGKFIHASVSKGVTISDLSEKYYEKYFYSFGRQ